MPIGVSKVPYRLPGSQYEQVSFMGAIDLTLLADSVKT